MKAKAQDVPAAFDNFPTGVNYAGPWPWGSTAASVAADFTRWYGRPPAAVLWVKPGMFIAGPVLLEPATSTLAINGDGAAEPTAGAEVGSAPAAPVEQTTSEDVQAPLDIIAAGPGRAEQWTQVSLI